MSRLTDAELEWMDTDVCGPLNRLSRAAAEIRELRAEVERLQKASGEGAEHYRKLYSSCSEDFAKLRTEVERLSATAEAEQVRANRNWQSYLRARDEREIAEGKLADRDAAEAAKASR